jgi:carbonic anhydrase/acetyltransferase-like protein (isoleucine patch superfamily)
MSLIPYKTFTPKISESVFIAPGVYIIGNVSIGRDSSIWFGSVIRGDVAKIIIGERTNIQDGTIIHVTRPDKDTIIGSGVTIGHKALLHACEIQDNAFIGMGSLVMDKVIVEEKAMVAAGAVVTPGKVIKTGEIWAGNPAKFMRKMSDKEIEYIGISASNYVKDAQEYLSILKNLK